LPYNWQVGVGRVEKEGIAVQSSDILEAISKKKVVAHSASIF